MALSSETLKEMARWRGCLHSAAQGQGVSRCCSLTTSCLHSTCSLPPAMRSASAFQASSPAVAAALSHRSLLLTGRAVGLLFQILGVGGGLQKPWHNLAFECIHEPVSGILLTYHSQHRTQTNVSVITLLYRWGSWDRSVLHQRQQPELTPSTETEGAPSSQGPSS